MTLVRQHQDILWPSLALLGLMFWIWGVVESGLVVTDSGIIDGFPVIFWVSLGIVIVSYIGLSSRPSTPTRTAYLITLLLVLLISLWWIPLVIGASLPVAGHKWAKTAQFVAPLMDNGHLDRASGVWFNWPGIGFVSAFARASTGIDELPGRLAINPFIPLLVSTILSLFLFVFLRTVWEEKYRWRIWLGLLIFACASYSPLIYISPQAFGFLMFMLIMWALVRLGRPTGLVLDGRINAILLLMLGAVVVTHLPSTVMVIGTLLIVYGSFLIGRRLQLITAVPLLFIIIVALIWNLTWAFPWISDRLSLTIAVSFDIQKLFQINVGDRVGEGSRHATIALFRTFYSGVWIFVGMLGAALALWGRNRRVIFPALLMVGASIGPAMVTLAIGGQMPEMIQRVYLFSLMPISFFGVYLLLRVKTAIILLPLLVAAPFFSILVHYGDQAGDYLSPDYGASVQFFHDRAVPGSLTMRGFDRVPYGKLRVPSLHQIQSYRTAAEALPDGAGDYVVLTESDRDFTQFFGRSQKEYQTVSDYVTNSERYSHVYSSPGVGIYTSK